MIAIETRMATRRMCTGRVYRQESEGMDDEEMGRRNKERDAPHTSTRSYQ